MQNLVSLKKAKFFYLESELNDQLDALSPCHKLQLQNKYHQVAQE